MLNRELEVPGDRNLWGRGGKGEFIPLCPLLPSWSWEVMKIKYKHGLILYEFLHYGCQKEYNSLRSVLLWQCKPSVWDRSLIPHWRFQRAQIVIKGKKYCEGGYWYDTVHCQCLFLLFLIRLVPLSCTKMKRMTSLPAVSRKRVMVGLSGMGFLVTSLELIPGKPRAFVFSFSFEHAFDFFPFKKQWKPISITQTNAQWLSFWNGFRVFHYL